MKVKIIIKWNTLLLLVFFSICSLGIYFFLKNNSQKKQITFNFFSKKDRYFSPLKILRDSSKEIPYVEINVENKTMTALIDLGYEGMLSLPSEIINELNNKKFIKRILTYGIRGKTYEKDLYKVEKINIEDNIFFHIEVQASNSEFVRDVVLTGKENPFESHLGRIGWNLFQKFNLLIDFKHATFALCDSLETLKQNKYPVDAFVQTSLSLDRGFIEFEAITEKGLLRCILDSGASWNLLNKDIENGNNDHMIFTGKDGELLLSLNPENKDLISFNPKDIQEVSIFKIEGKEFGPLIFNRIKCPIAFDAILGMEFLSRTLLFIDFANRKIYFFAHPSDEEKEKELCRCHKRNYGKIGIVQKNKK